MEPTPTLNSVPLRPGDFATLSEALEYAAQGETGINFYTSATKPREVVPYAVLRRQTLALARRLLGLGLPRGARVAIVAETRPDFYRFFFACQYAGLTPVPIPAVIQLGGRKSYLGQLRRIIFACEASVAVAPATFLRFLSRAADRLKLAFIGTPEAFMELPEKNMLLCPIKPKEVAYLQFTSCSTPLSWSYGYCKKYGFYEILCPRQIPNAKSLTDFLAPWQVVRKDFGRVQSKPHPPCKSPLTINTALDILFSILTIDY